jgi:hypothetical protein
MDTTNSFEKFSVYEGAVNISFPEMRYYLRNKGRGNREGAPIF